MKTFSFVLASVLVGASPLALGQNKACELTSPEELQATMGGKPTLKGTSQDNGVEVCTGKAAGSTVTIRLHPKKDDAEQEKEAAKLDALKKAGATVEARKVAGFNCMEVRPGGKAAREPYRTSCWTASSNKAPRYAVIEVSNPSTALEMKKLAPLAESIAGRLY